MPFRFPNTDPGYIQAAIISWSRVGVNDDCRFSLLAWRQAGKPREVEEAERAAGQNASDLAANTIAEYSLAVALVARTARQLLPAHGGYECKEPEPAKFTLAFRRVTARCPGSLHGTPGLISARRLIFCRPPIGVVV